MSQPLDPPPGVAALAQARQLGALLATYHPKRLGPAMLTLFAILIGGPLVLGVALGVNGVWPPVFVLVLPLVAVFVILLLRAPNFNRAQARRRVYAFEGGLVHVDRAGRLSDYRWDAVTSVQQKIVRQTSYGVHTGTHYLYTIIRNDGTVLKLTQVFGGIEQLGQGILEQVTRVHLPHAFAAVQRGETVPFGDLAVNAAGVVSVRHGLLPWTDLEGVSVVNGYVGLRKAGKWLPWSGKAASDIPNLFVFLTLADQLQRAAHGAHRP